MGNMLLVGKRKKKTHIKIKKNGTRALIKTFFHTPFSELNINRVNFAFNLHSNVLFLPDQ